MPKKSPTVPLLSGEGPYPEIAITDDQWRELETVLGREITQIVREEILNATFVLLCFSDYREEPIAKAKSRITETKTVAESLLSLLTESDHSNATIYADRLLDRFVGGNDARHSVAIGISSIIEASGKAIAEIASVRNPAVDWAMIWASWVRKLTILFDKHGLPTSARKDSDKNKTGSNSPFVCFVNKLQELSIPLARQRAAQSLEALATEITRARATGHDAKNEKR